MGATINRDNLVRGTAGLSKIVGVNARTVRRWVATGVLDSAIVIRFRRTLVFDLEKVFQALHHRPSAGTGGRRRQP